ncbi:MAG: helix-turn-helix domain-containing protein [Patescibacteria group bacterium]|nr:helix-turn-helix domain-containing protein [Patescibacteria group bacterium]
MTAVEKAVRLFGSQSALARALGLKPQAIHLWVKHGRVPMSRMLDVERVTHGRVTCEEMRPELYRSRRTR